jgi:glycosyltransferase involved in cell wall biosynthesis
MRIAQISPLHESVPPRLYGGTERIVHYLTEELVREGHDVTLFASGDSETSARLVPCCDKALRLSGARDPLVHHVLMLEKVFQHAREFDVIHSHIEYPAYPIIRRQPETPVLTTTHGRMDLPGLEPLYGEYSEIPLVSISDSQRAPLPGAGWRGTVHHGLPAGFLSLREEHRGYLAFLGRVSPEKRLDSAIRIAVAAGIPLEIAAKVDKQDEDFFHAEIEPLLRHPLVRFHGEIGDAEKQDFLGGAMALLFPVDWPEPFGLVMIEAMACGTPVIARARGSVPEVMRDGVSGFVIETEEQAVEAVRRIPSLSRAACRAYFEERFSAARMAGDYLALYRALIKEKRDGGMPVFLGGAAASVQAADWRTHGGGHQRKRQVLHNGQLLPGREAEPGAQARRDLRRFR